MPVDEQGIRADLIVDPGSVNARMNIGQLYEQGINRTSEFVRRKLEATFPRSPQAACDMLLDYYNDINPNYADLIKQVKSSPEKMREHVIDAIKNGIFLNCPPFLNTFYDDFAFERMLSNLETTNPKKAQKIRDHHGFTDKVKTPEQYEQNFFIYLMEKWDVPISRVTYRVRGDSGPDRTFTTEHPVCIGSKYMYLLCKVPEVAAPGVSHVSHTGIPMKTPAEGRMRSPISTNPVRFGEDEQRILALDVDGPENLRLMSLQSGSPEGVRLATETLLMSDHPTDIDRMDISTEELRDTNSVIGLFNHIMGAQGIDTDNTLATEDEFPPFMVEDQTITIMTTPNEEDEHGETD